MSIRARRIHRALLPALLLWGAATAPAYCTSTSVDPLSILAAAKRASGGDHWDQIGSLHQRGTLRQGGQDGSSDVLLDLKHMRIAMRDDVGPISEGTGWDGHAGWTQLGSNPALPASGKSALADNIGIAYRFTYAFFWPQRYPAKIEFAGRRWRRTHIFDTVRITPQNSEPFELWIDHRTHLIAREVDFDAVSPSTRIFADYRTVHGVRLPFSVRTFTGPTQSGFDNEKTLQSTTTGAALPQSAFAAPAPSLAPDPFPAGRDTIVVPIRIVDNHIFLSAVIDGGAPQTFIFDTGAPALLDQDHALAMHMPIEGDIPTVGFGSDTAHAGDTRIQSVAIGDATFPGQALYTFDLGQLNKDMKADIAGLLGVEIAQRAVVCVDYAHNTLTLTRPSAFKPPPTAAALPLKFNHHHPVVDGVIDGIAGEFEVDTGADNALTLLAPFSRAHDLFARYMPIATSETTGLGGVMKNVVVLTKALQLGGVTFGQVPTTLAADALGVAASPWSAGNIGGGLLRMMTVTFDYPHRTMYLEANTTESP